MKQSRHADVVLPSKMFVERNDYRDYRPQGINLFAISSKAIESFDSAKEDWEIWAELGKRLGYEEYFPWKDSNELIQFLLKDSSYTMEEVKNLPGGIFYSELNYKKYLKQGFLTPSKKLEIYSQILKKHGYDPLPTFHEPMESPVKTPEIAQKFPFIAITGARTVAYLGSQYRQSPSLRRIVPRPVMEINTIDAEKLKISTGDMVEVQSLRGKIEIEVKVTDDILPKVVSIPKGWDQSNVNYLTSDEFRDPNSGFPDYRVIMCSIKKI